MPNKQKGFTLIELLVVIVVIGILAGIVVNIIDVQEYQKQARDARRINDILSVQTAIINSLASGSIELANTSGCIDCNSITGANNISGNGWVKFINIKGRGLIDVISVLPIDPVNKDPYYFSYFSDGIDFELNAVFESRKYQINSENDGGNDDGTYERGFNLELR